MRTIHAKLNLKNKNITALKNLFSTLLRKLNVSES